VRPPIALVVAVAKNGVIGRGGALPWHLRSDLKRFKALTMGKPMVMGRKTFAAIGRPLPGRTTIVVTRQPDFQAEGVEVAHSWPAALQRAVEVATASGAGEIAVIGGGEIFAEALPMADRVYLTEVEAAPAGDAFFPPLAPAQWRLVRRESHPAGPQDEFAFAFADYERRRDPGVATRVAAPGGVA
jgi:dihydrofolate reductase